MKGYVQLRRGLLEHLKIMSPQEVTVYIGILLLASYKTASVNITVAELSDVVDICYKSTLKAIRRLEGLGYVKYTQAHNQWEVSKIEVLRYHNGKNASVSNAEPLTEPLTEALTEAHTQALSVSSNEINDLQNPNKYKEDKRSIKNNTTTISPEFLSLQTLWNSKMPWQVKSLTESRVKNLTKRLKDPLFKDNFATVCDKILASDFLSGRKPNETHPHFKADFDWIISNDTNYVKVLEGKYDEKKRLERGI